MANMKEPQTQAEFIRDTYRIAIEVQTLARATNGRVTRLERAYLILGGALITIFARELAPLIVRAVSGG